MFSTRVRAAAAPARRARRIPWVAVALFAFACLYRFNTLGGALGGFDDDHFMQLAYANQIRAGERPLVDYQGVGLQGAWPPLGFVASAAAQDVLGANLQAEAVLAVCAIAAGAVLTFAAASRLAPPSWALLTTVLSVLLAPKLYSFTKVLVLSAAALSFVLYARKPSNAGACALGVLTAAAFLFRHDFAVYVGAGVLVLFAFTRRLGPSRPVRHVLLYAVVTAALLVPSLAYVQRHLGLVEYLRFSRDHSAREAARTELVTPFPSLSADAEHNAEASLYWLLTLMPAGAAALAARRGVEPWWRAAVIAVAAMAAVAGYFMLRGNLGARFGDVGPVAAVLGAVLCGAAAARAGSGPSRAARIVVLAVVLAIAAADVVLLGSVSREIETGGWLHGPAGLARRAAYVSSQVAALPAAAWEDEDADDAMLVAQYVNRCTRPRDRVFLLSYAPELLPLSGRLFAGGVANLVITANTAASDAFILSRLQGQSVPLVLAEPDQLDPVEGRLPDYFPRVHAYLRSRYSEAGTLRAGGETVHVLATRARVPSGTFRATNLPCFR